jgi:hypothetical protein
VPQIAVVDNAEAAAGDRRNDLGFDVGDGEKGTL